MPDANSSWELAAFVKCARLGAICFLPTDNGKFLMQECTDHNKWEGTNRPPGGGFSYKDKDLRATIKRELQEEFSLDPLEIDQKLKFLGFEKRDQYWGNAVFELRNHGLKPGVYQASNSKDEKVKLVEVDLDNDDYTGPDPDDLIKKASVVTCECGGTGDLANDPEIHMDAVACRKCGKPLHATKAAMDFSGEMDKPIGYDQHGNMVTPRQLREEDPLDAPTRNPIDWSARLRRCRARRGEDEHGNPLPDEYKSARFFHEEEVRHYAHAPAKDSPERAKWDAEHKVITDKLDAQWRAANPNAVPATVKEAGFDVAYYEKLNAVKREAVGGDDGLKRHNHWKLSCGHNPGCRCGPSAKYATSVTLDFPCEKCWSKGQEKSANANPIAAKVMMGKMLTQDIKNAPLIKTCEENPAIPPAKMAGPAEQLTHVV